MKRLLVDHLLIIVTNCLVSHRLLSSLSYCDTFYTVEFVFFFVVVVLMDVGFFSIVVLFLMLL